MSDLLALVRDFFVAPAETGARPRAAPPPAACAAILGRPAEVATVAPALALALARGRGASVGVACGWRAGWGPGARFPPTGTARRLALRLDARGLAADATGLLVRVGLPDDPVAAQAAAERTAAAASCPVVVALGGPRDAVLDHLLATQDVVVLVHHGEADAALARAAEASLAELPAPVVACPLPTAGPLRALATAGIAAPPTLRHSLLPALEAVG
jgi:hypothetical protein